MADGKPCVACPWTSRDERDRLAVSQPAVQRSMQEGAWFACHVNLGTCHGARLRHEQHLRRTAGEVSRG